FLEYLRIALVVVQRSTRRRQTLDTASLETALLEPVRGARGEHEQGFQALRARALFDACEQFVATPAMTVVRAHRQTGQLAGIRVGDGIKRSAGDDQAVTFDDAELFDLALQHLARTAHQN